MESGSELSMDFSSANTTILSLPREEIQQSRQWLTDQAEANPEDAVP